MLACVRGIARIQSVLGHQAGWLCSGGGIPGAAEVAVSPD